MGTLPVSATPSGVVDMGFDLALGMSRVEIRASHKAKTEHVFSSLGVQERVGRCVNWIPPAGTVLKKYHGEICWPSISALGLDLRTPSSLIRKWVCAPEMVDCFVGWCALQ